MFPMADSPIQFSLFKSRRNMNNYEGYKEKASAELDKIGAEVNRLKARAAEAKAEQRIQLDEYLAPLEEKRKELDDQVSALKDSSSDAMNDLQRGLKDAWDRLAIAKKAAKARFH
jgi:chromosome segregation ATPase